MIIPTSSARKATAEFVGTAFLAAAVVGSGIAADRLSPGDAGLRLLETSIATGAVLVALILALQPVSAAFNPVITLIERAGGRISNTEATAIIAAQVGGGVLGAVMANVMFGLSAVDISTDDRLTTGAGIAEIVATIGLVIVVVGTDRSGRADRVAFAVGGYIAAGYWFTSSTCFANPAVTAGRMFSDTFAGIAPSSAWVFVTLQLAGTVVAAVLLRVLYPARTHSEDPTTKASTT